MAKEKNVGQLRWSCRRGLLELDVLLNRFLDRTYPDLSPRQQEAFAALLENSDQQLIDWLLVCNSQPTDISLQEIVALLNS